jgi:peptidoglycan hydrolase-like protein with peptidoglycan-binding domain
MTTWKITMAAALATVVFTGPAFAQSTTGSPASATMKSHKSAMHHKSRKGVMAMGDEKVKAAQQALKDKGHDPGSVDGKMGPKTQAALRDFQKAQGMEASGDLDTKTTQALGMDGPTTSSADSSSTAGSASPATSSPPATDTASDEKTEEKK